MQYMETIQAVLELGAKVLLSVVEARLITVETRNASAKLISRIVLKKLKVDAAPAVHRRSAWTSLLNPRGGGEASLRRVL